MANVRVLLGQFMKSREKAEIEDRPLAPGGQIDRKDSFLELALPNPELVLGVPGVIAFEPPPALDVRHEIPFEPPPVLDVRHEIGTEGPPPLGSPSVIPFEPPPALGSPSVIPFEPPPPLGVPTVIAFEPPPPLDIPTVVPFQRAPPPGAPGILPLPPNFNRTLPHSLPIMLAPAPGKPLDLPPPPYFGPKYATGSELSVRNLAEENGFKAPAQHGPGGIIEPTQDPLSRLKSTDSRVIKMFENLNDHQNIFSTIQGDGELDPLLFARGVIRAATGVGAARIALHALVQTSLYARNINIRGGLDSVLLSKAVGWNPLSLAPLPGSGPFMATTIDGTAMLSMGREARDMVTSAQSEAVRFIEAFPKYAENLLKNVSNNDQVQYQDNPILGVTTLVDDALNATQLILDPAGSGESLVNLSRFPSNKSSRLMKIFNQGGATLGDSYIPAVHRNLDVHSSPLANSAFVDGIIPVKFKGESNRGFLIKKKNQDSKIIDDEAYVPLSFTDLRPYGNNFRSVFFRPFITSLSEDFTPEWNKAPYFGRVDPVATYQGTGRNINLSFMIVSFGPEDVEMIYKKLNWLTSMVYPEYDKDLAYLSGPIVRLRVGDVINASGYGNNKGLPGIIDSLSFDYSDQIWELKKGLKVPRNVAVSMTFTVLHDMPVGIGAEGKFGGIGSIDSDGRYTTPGSANQTNKQAGKVNDTAAKVTKGGLNTFRTMGDEPDAANNYSAFNTSDRVRESK